MLVLPPQPLGLLVCPEWPYCSSTFLCFSPVDLQQRVISGHFKAITGLCISLSGCHLFNPSMPDSMPAQVVFLLFKVWPSQYVTGSASKTPDFGIHPSVPYSRIPQFVVSLFSHMHTPLFSAVSVQHHNLWSHTLHIIVSLHFLTQMLPLGRKIAMSKMSLNMTAKLTHWG